jgi:hypothetical protein
MRHFGVVDGFEICPLLNTAEVLPMSDSFKLLGRQLGVVRLCSGAVL